MDSEAVVALVESVTRGRHPTADLIAVLAAKRKLAVYIPTPVLAEVFQGDPADAALHLLLRRLALRVIPFDHAAARLTGALRRRDGLDSCHIVDCAVAATAIRLGGGLIVTGDPDDLRARCRDHPNVAIVPI